MDLLFFDLLDVGAAFALLTFWHFVADWLFQSHVEAMAKAKDRDVRAWHCVKYALAFVPVMLVFRLDIVPTLAAFTILLVSHYIIDSYVPVMLWAKHLRKAPQFAGVGRAWVPGWEDKKVEQPCYETDEQAFMALASTPLGLILLITMDQLFHIACLLPVAAMVVLLPY